MLAAKAKAASSVSSWVVVTTTFEDDYKSRGSWSEVTDVGVFSSKKAADNYKKQAQVNFVNEMANDSNGFNDLFEQAGPDDE